MLFNIWRWIQLWLIPYGLLIQIYKRKKALPANIDTKYGRKLKAIMINTEYGILFTAEKYIENRLKVLKDKQQKAFEANNVLVKEINELTMQQRELMYNREEEDGI